jgi:hypothetical protein
MNSPSRQRVFGTKPVAISRQATTQAVGPAELHHDGGKLISWAACSVVFAVAFFWTVAAGGVGADYHGPGAFLVHLMGPWGVTLFFALCGISCTALAAAYLRLLISGDRLAVRATPDGVATNGAWGRRSYAWRDIIAIGIHVTKPRSREIVFIRIDRFEGGSQMVSTSTIEGGRGEAERWIQQVQFYLHR